MTPSSRSRSASTGPAMPGLGRRAALGRIAAQRLLRHAALAGHLQAPREHRVGVLDHPRHQLVAGVHPQLAAGALDDRGRPGRSGRSARACRRAAARPPGAGRTSRARVRGCAIESGLVHAGVEQHEAVARGDRPRVAVRHARPRQRQAQAVDARQHPLAAAQLALAVTSDTRPETRLRPFSGVKEGCMADAGEGRATRARRCRRSPPACSRRLLPRKRISGSKAEAVAAPLLRGDRRARPRHRRRAVGGGRPRERARPGRHARARGRPRVHRAS